MPLGGYILYGKKSPEEEKGTFGTEILRISALVTDFIPPPKRSALQFCNKNVPPIQQNGGAKDDLET